MKIKKILFAFAILSVFTLRALLAQSTSPVDGGISCRMTDRSEVFGMTLSFYECDNGCTSTTVSTRNEDGSLSPVADYTSCPD